MKETALFIVCVMGCLSFASDQDIPKPNIIIMMADDMGIGDTSAYQDWTGNDDAVQVYTPNMEKLAKSGIRFTDAHTGSSRCTASRYSLLTGRYSWRTRLKYSVLWGPHSMPLIEKDQPTLGTLLKSKDYRTGMTGKWHLGLQYQTKEGKPALDWKTSDIRLPILDGPLNHGFDYFHGTSRSHPSSSPQGWIFQDKVVAATGPQSVNKQTYKLEETGPTNYRMGKRFLTEHLNGDNREKPFFLYYACHSNHIKHTPSKSIEGVPVKGRSNLKTRRSDFIYENDVALGLLMSFLEKTEDPRRPGGLLIENTLLVFTSDNGAENKSKAATGPVRSNKGSAFEGGHRVPFVASWPLGGIPAGMVSRTPICLVDMFATISGILKTDIGDAAPDSYQLLDNLFGSANNLRPHLIHHDHKEGGDGGARHEGAAMLAIRLKDPVVGGKTYTGQWKLFVDNSLLMKGTGKPVMLFNLEENLQEENDYINDPAYKPLVDYLFAKVKIIHDSGISR